MKSVLQVFVICVIASGCAREEAAPADTAATPAVLDAAPAGPVVATVNGEALTAPLLEVFARGRRLDPQDPLQRRQALEQLVETVVLAQDAKATGLAEQPDVQAEVALAGLLQLSGRRLRALRDEVPLGEEELTAFYQQEVERAGAVEVHLQHILFDTEAAALEAAGKALRPDADFEALMGEYAAKGALQARDLDWANLGQLPPAVAAAAKQMADGEVLAAPVQTRFGWHVLRRVASRPFTPPPLEEVREGARRQLTDRAIADKVKALRAAAEVEFPGDAASPAPAVPAAPTGG